MPSRLLANLKLTSIGVKLILMICLFFAAITGVTARQILLAYHESLADGVRETQNLARSLAQQVDETFQSGNMLMAEISDRITTDGTSPDSITKLEVVIRRRLESEQKFHDLLVIDSQGNGIARGIPSINPNLSFTDRSYFIDRSTQDNTQAHIDGPFIARSDNSTVLIMSRRVNHPDGSFAGVIVASIPTNVFDKLFAQVDIGAQGMVHLTSEDGLLLVRRPYAKNTIGMDLANSPYYLKNYVSDIEFTTNYKSLADGVMRIGTVHKIPWIQMQLGVTFPQEQILANWRRRTKSDLEVLASALAISILISTMIWRQMHQKEAIDSRYRLLAENSKDVIICLDEHGIRRFVSPSFCVMTGWTQEQVKDTTSMEFIYPDDHEIVLAADKLILSNQGQNMPPCRYRYVLANGGTIWVESVTQRAKTRPGHPMEFVINIRDIENQKRSEDALIAANTRLTALSMTDGLTGLANRRQFDDVLERAWKRAIRQQSPLGLLMVDVDKFKDYNDLYGHLAGDQCLISVARVLQNEFRRPDDLVSRYGGEEFSIILAGMPSEQIEALAEQLRQSLFDLGIPHAGLDAGVVTISIGLAIVTPHIDEDAKSLIDLADLALYQAKNAGRNRVALAQRVNLSS